MGSADSANYEWIELHNDGAAIDVTGWMLTDGMNLQIDLEGVIPANMYSVLERTSDASAPGTAFLIYTGALVNTGATLRLEHADGTLVDQVSGGEGWQNIGGDNTTKETAQYTSSGWVTAAPTPGKAPSQTTKQAVTESVDKTLTSTASNSTTAQKSDSTETVRLTLPDITLELDIDGQSVGYVNQPINFTVTPGGIGDTLIDSLHYQWNFGDGQTAVGEKVTHNFPYPGTYVVTVFGEYKRQQQVARHEITILPVVISLTQNSAGDVQVNNDSPYEVDVSGYRVKGNREFIFPDYSVILPNQTVTLPRAKVTTFAQSMVALYDTEGLLVATQVPPLLRLASTRAVIDDSPIALTVPPPRISAISYTPPVEPHSSPEFGFSTTIADPPVAVSVDSFEAQPQVASVMNSEVKNNERWTYVGLVTLILLGIFGIYATPRRNEIH